MEKIKTIRENKVLINTPIIELQELPTLTDILNNLENYILSLPRWNNHSKYDNPYMLQDNDGEYIKLEDVLTLFSAKK